MAKQLELYYDLMSQPSRTLYIFFNLAKIPFTKCPIAIRNGEHLSEEFAQNINRFKKIPCINDKDFKLGESVAIVRYIAREYSVPDFWYPKDSQRRAKIDEYLEWQHLNTRQSCATLFRTQYIMPRMFGKTVDESVLNGHRKNVKTTLDMIENVWLKEQRFIAGNELSIADLFAITEITQLKPCNYDITEGRPNIKQWMERVREQTNPYFDEAHVIIEKIVQHLKNKL